MRHYLFVVEGVHDAAFFGRLLIERAFVNVEDVAHIGELWDGLVPKAFPPYGKLQHVVKYPDVYISRSTEQSVAIVIAGSDSALVAELRDSISIVDPAKIDGLVIISDADNKTPSDRFDEIISEITLLNKDLEGAGIAGIPLRVPDGVGRLSEGTPPLSIYILPDNASQGTLETVIIACATASFPEITKVAAEFIVRADKLIEPKDRAFKKFRKGSGRYKALVGAVGNLFFPGSSLAISVAKGDWFRSLNAESPELTAARTFLKTVLG